MGIITCLLSTLAEVDAIVAAYAKGGTYRTPRVDHDLTGQAIGDFAQSVWTVFPDASLEVISIGDTGGGLVAIQWMLHGTQCKEAANKHFADLVPPRHGEDDLYMHLFRARSPSYTSVPL